MEITLTEQRALILKEQLPLDQAEGRAWTRKMDAFGRMVKMTSLVQRPRDEDFELVYREHRHQPFWHVVCTARYVYERQREIPVVPGGPEVESVTIEGVQYRPEGGKIMLRGLEHCREELESQVFVDAYTGEQNPALERYLEFPATEVPLEELDSFAPEGVIMVPPQTRASAIVREVLVGMIKSVQADRILEDRVEVERVDLYYRPVYAFQYRWKSKEREAILEFDALTGQLEAGERIFQQYVGKILDPDFLFDVGVDTVDLFVPGGGIAIKLARKGIDVARGRRKS